MNIKCEHCGQEYETQEGFLNDCFASSDGWTWEHFHNCQRDKGIEIHGYKTIG